MLALDHITVIAASLEDGVAHVRRALGIDMPAGGKHVQMGTHNHLLRLGDDLFLEVIAIDLAAAAPSRSRWFAMDRFGDAPPRLACWVARTNDLGAALSASPSGAGHPVQVSRGELTWRISVPDDGSMAFDGAYPTIIEWHSGKNSGPHPATRMHDLGCELIRFQIEHPQIDQIQRYLAPIFRDSRVFFANAPRVRFSAQIATPTGIHQLV